MAIQTHIDRREENAHSVFSHPVPEITLEKLQKYCEVNEIPLTDLTHDSSHYVPGNALEGLFRTIFKKIGQNNPTFPINFLESFIGGNGGTKENRIFINQPLTMWIDIKTPPDETGPYVKFTCGIDVMRNDEIVFSGIYVCIGERR